MTEQTENEGNPPEPKGDDVRTMIREELKAILPELTASLTKTGEPATDSEEENESATSKMIERSEKKQLKKQWLNLENLFLKHPHQRRSQKAKRKNQSQNQRKKKKQPLKIRGKRNSICKS